MHEIIDDAPRNIAECDLLDCKCCFHNKFKTRSKRVCYIRRQMLDVPDLIRMRFKKERDHIIESINEIYDESKPWHDPESLFCDTLFLEQLIGKPPRKGKECKDI